MPLTKKRFAEICLVYLSGGRIAAGTKVDIRELYENLQRVLNSMLKTSFFAENIALGETIPSGLISAEYSGVPIYQYRNVSALTLPISPVKLPRNMGLFSIAPDSDVFAEFIPLQAGDLAKMSRDPILSDMFGQVGFEMNGAQVILSKDLTINSTQTPTVTLRLVVNNLTDLGDFDFLPIPADLEWPAIQAVLALYGVEPNPDKLVDSGVQIPGQTSQI